MARSAAVVAVDSDLRFTFTGLRYPAGARHQCLARAMGRINLPGWGPASATGSASSADEETIGDFDAGASACTLRFIVRGMVWRIW
ncbi:MAG: hypothetical protein DRG83_19930 [Deltaproteobacteria bacterium]|nr:MAG: hypothetical protein DRG83_19930 [Deltaproteobacteria bacterium]